MKSPLIKSRFLSSLLPRKRRLAIRKATNFSRCNICGRVFRAATHFQRFCKACRMEDELFKFAEWLPQT